MKEVKRTLFKCGFCGKHYFQRRNCHKHESICHLNPCNHHKCFDCAYLEKFDEEFIIEKYDNASFNKVLKCKGFICKKTGQKMYSRKALMIGHYCIESNDYEMMPYDCNNYKSEYQNIVAENNITEKETKEKKSIFLSFLKNIIK